MYQSNDNNIDMSASLPQALGESILAPSEKREGKESWWVRQGKARQCSYRDRSKPKQQGVQNSLPRSFVMSSGWGAVRPLMRLSLAPSPRCEGGLSLPQHLPS